MFGGIGFKNSDIAPYNIVTEANQASSTGSYFQDSSTLVSIKNIHDTQNNPAITTDQFNAFLKTMQETCIVDVCRKVVANQPDFISSENLYPLEKEFENLVSKTSRFVCLKVRPTYGTIVGSVSYLELALDGVVTFNVYLYNSNIPETPIKTQAVISIANSVTLVEVAWDLVDSDMYKGGEFYLGYFEEDLGTVSAYKKDNFAVDVPFISIEPYTLDYNGARLDIESANASSYSFGINIGINVYHDYTELIINSKFLFWDAIMLQMQEKVLLIIKRTTRTKGDARILQDIVSEVHLALYGSVEMGVSGVQYSLKNAIETLQGSIFPVMHIWKGTLR